MSLDNFNRINIAVNYARLAKDIKAWGSSLGFQAVGISDTQLDEAETHLMNWLAKGYHGEMDYMHRHGTKRSRPADLQPGTLRVISVRMDYLPEPMHKSKMQIEQSTDAFISRYALGRDYHKVMRKQLQKLADKINHEVSGYAYRVYCDSAPVLEKALAQKAGLGWIGKHTNLIHEQSGSWFFLGEIYTDLPLPTDLHATNHCGTCQACIDICPTQAIVAPYQVDARRCISYLTIELRGSIPVEFRKQIGNRIYGCDDCQLVCPWNKFATQTQQVDFLPRHNLDKSLLIELFGWCEQEFLDKTKGSAIRRIGYECWMRNIAVALGNSGNCEDVVQALYSQYNKISDMVDEHIDWAVKQLTN